MSQNTCVKCRDRACSYAKHHLLSLRKKKLYFESFTLSLTQKYFFPCVTYFLSVWSAATITRGVSGIWRFRRKSSIRKVTAKVSMT